MSVFAPRDETGPKPKNTTSLIYLPLAPSLPRSPSLPHSFPLSPSPPHLFGLSLSLFAASFPHFYHSQLLQEVPSHVVLPPNAGPPGGSLLWHGAQCRPYRQVCHHQQDQQHTHVSIHHVSVGKCASIRAFEFELTTAVTVCPPRLEQRFFDEVHKDKADEIHCWKMILKRDSSSDDQV